ncbi:hypothetical protein ACHQM5_002892 [Ranunculus cassubicifolius]
MKRSLRSSTRISTTDKEIRVENSTDDDDSAIQIDSDDEGGDEERKEEGDELIRKEKGKSVIDVSDDDSEWDCSSDDSDDDDSDVSVKKIGFIKKKRGKEDVVVDQEKIFGGEGVYCIPIPLNAQPLDIGVVQFNYAGGNVEAAPNPNNVGLLHVNHATAHISRRKRKRGRKGENRLPLLWELMEDENDDWLDEHQAENIDGDAIEAEVTETAEASEDLILPLLRYQKEWLAWALKQEESVSRGGILADEMGMGKTIQAIALVLAKRAISQRIGEPSVCSTTCSSSGELPQINCTLVICPVVAVLQWASEISRFTAEGSTRVLVYHGASRKKCIEQFSDYDFVLTTYSIVENEYRKNVMPPKGKCVWCGKSFLPKQMSTHLRYFCGPNAIRTVKQSKQERKKGKEWPKSSEAKKKGDFSKEDSDESDVRKGKKTSKKGKKEAKKGKKEKELGEADDCSQSGEAEASSSRGSQKNSILHSVRWNRIILDEAHFIKDRRSNTAKAVLALQSLYKWALSGTPLQNRVGELYSLVRFLQITPYSYYFCKDCDCKSLDFSSTTQCPSCPHKSVRHFCWWNKSIATPIQNSSSSYDGKRAMILLKHKLLKGIVIRRTKKGRASDLALPPRIITLRRDTLDVKEEDYYESLYSESQLQFNTYIEAGTLMNNYAHIFDLLTRLRQAADHPYLVIYSNSAVSRSQTNANAYNGEQECGICHDPAEDQVVTSCEHVFCKACLTEYAAALGHASCPSCSKPLTADFTTKVNPEDTKRSIKGYRCSSILNRINLQDFQTSTKIEALREEIRFMVERDGSAKGIVFSQFTSFLDLISYSLKKSGIQCVQLVGSMTMAARDTAIKRFTDDPKCRIFLMSLKAGGVALNLTVASHVFLMDPWWNPAVERQAQDRIHRIGQYKPIRITRFVIENTVEERILKLQAKKELVFEGTVGGSAEALVKLTEADLKFLFAT